MVTKMAERPGTQARMAERVVTQQEIVVVNARRGVTAVTAEELGAELTGPYVAPPADLAEHVETWIENLKGVVAERTEANMQRALAQQMGGPQPQLGGPITGVAYEYWDIRATSPQQFITPPFNFRPHKIIGAGEFALLSAVLFINPLSPNGNPSATQYLGGRGFRVRFEQMNLTNVSDGPDFTFVGNFPSPAPVITTFSVGIIAPNPGLNPALMELNVTADITDPAQPFAAFGTQWLDIEGDPGFPVPQPGGFRFQVPLRYLVYPSP